MTDLVLSGKAADKLRELAEREQRPVEDVVLDLIEQHSPTEQEIGTDEVSEAGDPLVGMIGLLDGFTNETDLSTTVRETLKKYTHPKYGWTKRDRTD